MQIGLNGNTDLGETGMRFDWTILADNIDLIARGALNTFLVLLLALFFGSIIGALVCAGNLQTRRLMRLPSRVYVHVFRTVRKWPSSSGST